MVDLNNSSFMEDLKRSGTRSTSKSEIKEKRKVEGTKKFNLVRQLTKMSDSRHGMSEGSQFARSNTLFKSMIGDDA